MQLSHSGRNMAQSFSSRSVASAVLFHNSRTNIDPPYRILPIVRLNFRNISLAMIIGYMLSAMKYLLVRYVVLLMTIAMLVNKESMLIFIHVLYRKILQSVAGHWPPRWVFQ